MNDNVATDSPADSTLQTTPPSRPGVFSALGAGWSAMKDNFLYYFLAVLVLGVVQAPLQFQDAVQHSAETGEQAASSPLYGLLMFAYMLLLVPVFKYSADLLFVQGVRRDQVEVKTLIAGFSCYLNVVLASLMVIGLVGIGLILLVIPGLYVACRLAFVTYLVMDEGLDPIAAVEASWRLTRGHVLKIFFLAVMSVLICLLGLLLLVVGIIPALMWVKAAFASLYVSIAA